MIHKVKGIVLHHVKYKESSAIVHIYTDIYGRQSYLVNSIRGKKSRYSGNLLQALTLLELEAYHKEGRDIQRLKELRNHIPYRSIPFDMQKNSQVLFLAEILYKVLREEEANPDLFDFLESSLQLLDVSDEGMVNFHLLFLVELTKFLGFFPEDKPGAEMFDMRNGQFKDGTGLHSDFFDAGSSLLLKNLIGSGFSDLSKMFVNQAVRKLFLENMMDYYRLHSEGFGKVKSLSVLNEIYRDEEG